MGRYARDSGYLAGFFKSDSLRSGFMRFILGMAC